jgi:glycerol-3-phosphate dehydrogenase (NAD(P)+)
VGLARGGFADQDTTMNTISDINRIGIVGAGAWGTALAVATQSAGRDVVLWARESAVVSAINEQHRNTMFLPDAELDPSIKATSDYADIAGCDAVLLVAPAQFLRSICADLSPLWRQGIPAVVCAKGIEQGTGALMTSVVQEALPQAPLAVLSGPTFADEVARGLPTAITLACEDQDLGQALIKAIGTKTFRPYLASDLVGAEVGGAVKNVLAIACGIVTGRKLGSNARAALINRGLAEMMRLGWALGGKPETMMGLSGMGDLVLTCSSEQSRNMSLGAALGRGERLADILNERNSVAEGVASAPAVTELAARLNVDMPICAAVNAILHHESDVGDIISGLMARPFRSEVL